MSTSKFKAKTNVTKLPRPCCRYFCHGDCDAVCVCPVRSCIASGVLSSLAAMYGREKPGTTSYDFGNCRRDGRTEDLRSGMFLMGTETPRPGCA